MIVLDHSGTKSASDNMSVSHNVFLGTTKELMQCKVSLVMCFLKQAGLNVLRDLTDK